MTDDWTRIGPLEGRVVRLEPLTAEHADELAGAADDPAMSRWTGADLHDREQARRYIDVALADPARVPFLQRDRRSGRCVGSTSYYRLDPVNRGLAIGYTWLGTAARGTSVNPESKFLLLEHAFVALEAVRVEWHTDALNERSRAAIAKLGAEFEGLLRKHRRRPDGSFRTTALYAMTDDDWPSCRAELMSRLNPEIGPPVLGG